MRRFLELALRNVGRNARRSIITGVAIFFGVSAVVLLRGFVAGSAVLMEEDVVQGRAGAIQIHKKGYLANVTASPLTLTMPYDEALLARVKAVPGVAGVTGRVQFQGLLGDGAKQTMFVGRGIDVVRENEACPKSNSAVEEGGRGLGEGDGPHVVIGNELAQSFKFGLGKTVSVQAASPGGRSNALDLTLVGLSTGMLPFENKRVLSIPLSTAQSLVGLEGKVTDLAVGVVSLKDLDDVAARLSSAMGDEYEVHTWKEIQPFVRDIIVRQNIVLGGLSFVLFIIVLTGIINTMLMSVFERVREIGTMLAVGVRRRQVALLFVLEAAVIGAAGGTLGAALSSLVLFIIGTRGIPFKITGSAGLSMLRPYPTLTFSLGAVAIAFTGAVLAALWPAWRASRLNPVDALRNS